MKKGDILLIQNFFDPVGWIISLCSKYRYHHVAWAINDHELIELKAVGKRKVLLSCYLNKPYYHCKLIRIKNILPCQLNEVIRRAKKAKFSYSYTSSLINFILIKLKITKELPRLSCSGFISLFLSQMSFYFCSKGPKFVTPKDIGQSLYVKEASEELYQ